jgi:hypothetical protein
MKAKCPFCLGGKNANCEKCHSTGSMSVGFAEGNIWTRKCTNPECGVENGGCIVKGDKEPQEASGPCPWCKCPTHWLFLGNTDEIEQE